MKYRLDVLSRERAIYKIHNVIFTASVKMPNLQRHQPFWPFGELLTYQDEDYPTQYLDGSRSWRILFQTNLAWKRPWRCQWLRGAGHTPDSSAPRPSTCYPHSLPYPRTSPPRWRSQSRSLSLSCQRLVFYLTDLRLLPVTKAIVTTWWLSL